MSLDTETEIRDIKGRSGNSSDVTNGQEDISVQKTSPVGNVSSFTVFLDAAGAVDVTIELSPDGGSTWYEPRKESPVSFSGANEEIVQVEYNATDIRVTGSDTTAVEVQIREVV